MDGHEAGRRAEADHAAERRGQAQRAAEIRALGQRTEAGGQRDGAAARRAPGRQRRVPGVARDAKTSLKVFAPAPNSGVFVLPSTIAPAARSLWTTSASSSGTWCS